MSIQSAFEAEGKFPEFKSQYQQIQYQTKTKMYKYIGREREYNGEHGLVLSLTESGRIKVEEHGRTYKNQFCKTYDDYRAFLKEWEEII